MRLLNTSSLRLEEHNPEDEKYAILSHTWGKREVSFRELQSLSDDGIAELLLSNPIRHGYEKIVRFCTIAHRLEYKYVWIDTCCIDKESSSELSESINSMYKWYESSAVCFAYLEDYYDSALKGRGDNSHVRSRWFERGWTLQELIAPAKVEFYNAHWHPIGSKHQLADSIGSTTGIDPYLLRIRPSSKAPALRAYSVATKFSWAARRRTTRKEDEAYCLMGLFDINMPLLYGEGKKAFRRLQENIIASTSDHSIMLWSRLLSTQISLLAPSPKCFLGCGDVIAGGQAEYLKDNFSASSKGISLVCPVVEGATPNQLSAVLNCRYETDLSGPILLPLLPLHLTDSQRIDDDLMVFLDYASIRDFPDEHRFETFNPDRQDSSLSPFQRFVDVKHDLGIKKLLLVENEWSSTATVNRITISIRTCPTFDELFQFHSSRQRYDPRTKTLTWIAGDYGGDAGCSTMSWTYCHQGSDYILSIYLTKPVSYGLNLMASTTALEGEYGWDFPDAKNSLLIHYGKGDNTHKLETSKGSVKFRLDGRTVLGDFVHILHISFEPATLYDVSERVKSEVNMQE